MFVSVIVTVNVTFPLVGVVGLALILQLGFVLSIVTLGVNVLLALLFHALSATALAALTTVNAPFHVTQLITNLYKYTPLLTL